jgi:hypothetical protein
MSVTQSPIPRPIGSWSTFSPFSTTRSLGSGVHRLSPVSRACPFFGPKVVGRGTRPSVAPTAGSGDPRRTRPGVRDLVSGLWFLPIIFFRRGVSALVFPPPPLLRSWSTFFHYSTPQLVVAWGRRIAKEHEPSRQNLGSAERFLKIYSCISKPLGAFNPLLRGKGLFFRPLSGNPPSPSGRGPG